MYEPKSTWPNSSLQNIEPVWRYKIWGRACGNLLLLRLMGYCLPQVAPSSVAWATPQPSGRWRTLQGSVRRRLRGANGRGWPARERAARFPAGAVLCVPGAGGRSRRLRTVAPLRSRTPRYSPATAPQAGGRDGAGRRPEEPLKAGARHRGEPEPAGPRGGPSRPAPAGQVCAPKPRALCGNVQKWIPGNPKGLPTRSELARLLGCEASTPRLKNN